MKPLVFNEISSFKSFQTPLWCKGGHLQTLAGHFLRNEQLDLGFEQKSIKTHDGDELVAFHFRGSSEKVITLFHGLAGSSNSGYMMRLGNLFSRQGHSVLLVNHRGAHPYSPIAKGIYHSGRSEDLSSVFGWLRQDSPDLMIIAIGFSMSANILLLNLAGMRSEHQPDFAVVANAPLNLEDACRLLDKGLNRIYGMHFTKELTTQHNLDKWKLTIRGFDEEFTAPKAGYQNANDYYSNCSAAPHVHKIKVPTVVLTADDDPFISSHLYRNLNWPHSVHLRIERTGGHLGYIQDHRKGKVRWLDEYLNFIVQKAQK